MTENNINDLRKARYMSLSCPPASPEAKSLVDDIINIIAKSEKRQRARKADEVPVFKSAVGLIIGDLLIGFHTKEAGWSYLSMSTSAFSDRPVGYKTFKTIVETMEAAGLIKVSLGRNSKNIQFNKSDKVSYSPGFATRFKPTPLLVSMAEKAGVQGEAVTKHFPPQLPKQVIEVRARSQNNRGHKIKGQKLQFSHTEKSRAMEAEVKELNRFFVSFDLDGAGFSGFRRLFHEGDIKGFDFQWGGRLYGVGDFNYQGMRKADRPNLLINCEPISEIDINASYLSILHGISGYDLPDREDIYDIGSVDRRIIKIWISTTMGHTTFHGGWRQSAMQMFKEAGIKKPKSMTMPSLQPIILEYFPMLADWPSQRVTWADLMFIESEIVIGTMLELMRSYGAPSFPVHDSIIVRKSDTELALDILSQQFSSKTGIRPKLKVK